MDADTQRIAVWPTVAQVEEVRKELKLRVARF
jgi:hypothetical protein